VEEAQCGFFNKFLDVFVLLSLVELTAYHGLWSQPAIHFRFCVPVTLKIWNAPPVMLVKLMAKQPSGLGSLVNASQFVQEFPMHAPLTLFVKFVSKNAVMTVLYGTLVVLLHPVWCSRPMAARPRGIVR
jgi:hypothetical protein